MQKFEGLIAAPFVPKDEKGSLNCQFERKKNSESYRPGWWDVVQGMY